MRFRTFTALAAVVGAGLFFVPTVGAAPEAQSAEIVFANGGRIVSVQANGENRRVLTRKAGPVVAERSWDEVTPVEDSMPSISPDGEHLLFQRKFEQKNGRWRTELIVADRDGSDQRAIVRLKMPVITWLGWTPDGRIALSTSDYDFDGRIEWSRFRVLTFDRNGGDRSLVLSREFNSKDFRNPERLWSSQLALADFSPEGKMLYTDGDLRQTYLRERDLETGEDRVVLKGVDQATYSPDGSRLAVTPDVCQHKIDDEPEVCPGWKFGIWTVKLDGTGRTRLTGKAAGGTGLKWSPDGSRILFTSARNFPGSWPAAAEIYSVGADGKCLAWHTNGSPASIEASWASEALDAAPASCGNNGLEPLVEVRPRKDAGHPVPRLWAGPILRGRLLSSTSGDREYESFYYEDCGYFERSRCGEGIMLESIPLCNPGNMGQSVSVFPARIVPSIRRGAWMNTMRTKRSVSGLLVTGTVSLTFGDSWFISTGGIPTTTRDLDAVVRNLRPVGRPANANGKLAPPVAAKGTNRYFSRIYRVYRQTGSIARTARITKTSRVHVKTLVRHRYVFRKLMPFKERECPR